MGVFILLAALVGSTTPKPVSRRSMRMLRVGGIRAGKTLTYRHAAHNYVCGWDDWDDCCVDYLIQQEEKVRASQLDLDEAISMLYDSVLDDGYVPAPTYACDAIEWEHERVVEDMENDALDYYQRTFL